MTSSPIPVRSGHEDRRDQVVVGFVASFSRSGSTLLERILDSVPGIVGVGELAYAPGSIRTGVPCGCGRPVLACPFWSRVWATAFPRGEDPDLEAWNRARRALDTAVPRRVLRERDAATTLVADAHRRVYAAVRALTGCHAIVDSSKVPTVAGALVGQPGIELRVIHLVRDPRGVACSWGRDVPLPGASGRMLLTREAGQVARRWLLRNLQVHHLRRRGAVPVLPVRYEDLVADPVGVVAQVVRFLGVHAPLPRGLRPHSVELATGHGIAGNPMRSSRGVVPIRADQRWRRDLAMRDRLLVSGITLPLRGVYGYARGPRRTRVAG